MLLTVKPLQPAPGSAVDFGVEIDGVDLEHLTGKQCMTRYRPFGLTGIMHRR